MSQSTRAGAARGRCGASRKRNLPRSSATRRSGFEEESGLQPSQFRLLIDENRSPRLVRLARRRGFHALHVNDINLRTAGDKHVARHAVSDGMILVTNNLGDFTRLHERRALHPDLIFLQCNVKRLFTERNQATMLSAALDDLVQNDLIQEVISVTLVESTGKT